MKLAFLGAGLSLLIPVASAQRVLRESMIEYAPCYRYGFSVAPAGDVDGDGSVDSWMGSPVWCQGMSVYLCSGADGTPTEFVHRADPGQQFGFSLAGGQDLSGDGVPDLVVGAPPEEAATTQLGAVHVFSGSDASALYSVAGTAANQRFGEALAFLGDLDGDGTQDFVVGAPGDDGGGIDRGSVRAFSGASGAPLGVVRGLQVGGQFGSALAGVGDVDGDGAGDLLVGASFTSGTAVESGAAVLVSGRTGATLRSIAGEGVGARFGHSVGAPGDLDGDTVPDLVAGAPGSKVARAYSGASGALLWSVSRTRTAPTSWTDLTIPPRFGWAVCGIGDQDGDGRGDVAVSDPLYSGVWFFSGADGAELGIASSGNVYATSGGHASTFLGWSLARLPDLDGDGRDELLAGAPLDAQPFGWPTSSESGSVDVIALGGPKRGIDFVEGDIVASRMARAGDVDADGLQDIAVGLWLRATGTSEVRILSGRNDRELRRYTPGSAMACVGDLDGDGREELALSSAGTLQVFSGRTGAPLPGFDAWPAWNVASIGDCTGDGCPDVIAESSTATRVISGADASLSFELPVSISDGAFTAVGDWNRDGAGDFALGFPQGGATAQGSVCVYSGTDGALLTEILGPGNGFEYDFGIDVSGAPDFDYDGDGYVDLVVGEQYVGYGPHPSDGSATVFSSRDGSVIGGTYLHLPLGYGVTVGPGYAVAALPDFDGDGYSDIAVSNPAAASPLGVGAGEVVVRSGGPPGPIRGRLLRRLTGTSSWDYLGYSLVNAGDTDGNGTTDLLVSAPASEIPSARSYVQLTRNAERRTLKVH